MSQAYDFNSFPNTTPDTESWFNNQFISAPDGGQIPCPDQQQVPHGDYGGFNTSSKLTPQTLIKNEVDGGPNFIEHGLFNNGNGNNMNHNNDSIQFNQFIANNGGIPGITSVNNNGSYSNSSDKSSSPSTILNNAPLNSNNFNEMMQKDEKDMTEKELADKRKAQNRAAQRAFRERKELKLKELEEKLNKSEYDREILLKQLEDLKKKNVVISTENKLLLQNGNTLIPLHQQQNNSYSSSSSSTTLSTSGLPKDSSFSFPSGHFQQEQIQEQTHHQQSIPKEKSLTITEVWEYLSDKNDPSLDLNAIMNEIKGLEVCHEHGASYPISTVDKIVSQHKLKRKRK